MQLCCSCVWMPDCGTDMICLLCCTQLGPTDDLCLLRPTSISAADYHPVPSLMPASCNTNWSSPGTTTPSLRPAYTSSDATWPTTWYDDAAQDGCVAQDDVPPVGLLSSLDLPPGVGISGQTALLYLVPGVSN